MLVIEDAQLTFPVYVSPTDTGPIFVRLQDNDMEPAKYKPGELPQRSKCRRWQGHTTTTG
jgi:hypothetical protein